MALCDNDGFPLKGQKSFTTKIIEKRYEKAVPQVILNSPPPGWVPECCILEGMFMLNTNPLMGTHKTFSDYGDFLFTRFIVPQWLRGSKEVHVIFDTPRRAQKTPKQFERNRRDNSSSVLSSHICVEVTSALQIPPKWRENFINCRDCKRKLSIFLTSHFLHSSAKKMQPGKVLLVAGGFTGSIEDTAWAVTNNLAPYPNPRYTCNAEETDTRMWLHVKQTSYQKILIMSPDTDCYHIGMPLNHGSLKDVVVQLNKYTSKELNFFSLSAFITALETDPDLSSIPSNLLPQIFTTLFVATGCDYISFFSRIGKTTFYRYFFQHAEFVTSGRSSTPGMLADVSIHDDAFEMGFLAFLRLVGVTYFKKNNSGFSHATPQAFFNSFADSNLSPLDHHKKWIDSIRLTIGDRCHFENEMLPSTDALYRHWKRSCWVLDMWGQANQNSMELQPLSAFGWTITNNTLTIDWDSKENIEAVGARVTTC